MLSCYLVPSAARFYSIYRHTSFSNHSSNKRGAVEAVEKGAAAFPTTSLVVKHMRLYLQSARASIPSSDLIVFWLNERRRQHPFWFGQIVL